MTDDDIHYLERNFWKVIIVIFIGAVFGFVFGEVFIWG